MKKMLAIFLFVFYIFLFVAVLPILISTVLDIFNNVSEKQVIKDFEKSYNEFYTIAEHLNRSSEDEVSIYLNEDKFQTDDINLKNAISMLKKKKFLSITKYGENISFERWANCDAAKGIIYCPSKEFYGIDFMIYSKELDKQDWYYYEANFDEWKRNNYKYFYNQDKNIDNSFNNINNDGLVTSDDKWIYYTNHDDGDKLYKLSMDTNKKIKLNNTFSYNLNVIDNYIYYTDGIPGNVYRLNLDNGKADCIISIMANNLALTDKYVIYRKVMEAGLEGLYRANLDGSDEKLLANNVACYTLDTEWIYYANKEDENKLYKINFDGKNNTKITDDQALNIATKDGYIYYSNICDGEKLYRVKNDGTARQELLEDRCFNINLYGNYIYYTNQDENGKLYRAKLNNSERTLIANREKCVSINISKGYMTYRTLSDENGWKVMKLDDL